MHAPALIIKHGVIPYPQLRALYILIRGNKRTSPAEFTRNCVFRAGNRPFPFSFQYKRGIMAVHLQRDTNTTINPLQVIPRK